MKLSQPQLMDIVYHIQGTHDARKCGILPLVSMGVGFMFYAKEHCNSYLHPVVTDYELVLYNVYYDDAPLDHYDIYSLIREFIEKTGMNIKEHIYYESLQSIIRTYKRPSEDTSVNFILIKDLLKILE